MAVPLLAVAPAAGGGQPPEPTEVNVTDDISQRYGEPQIAVNPKNPKNIVYTIMSNQSTYECEESGDPNCQFPEGTLGQAFGFWAVPGWFNMKTYVSFNGGKTFKEVKFPNIPAFSNLPNELPGKHKDLITRADPMVTVTADGTFYMAWDAQAMDDVPPLVPPNPLKYSVCCSFVAGGIAISKSTDGGKTWSIPRLTGTGVNRPWLVTDLSTGTIYEASAGAINGLQANGNPAGSVLSSDQDRYVVSSKNGLKWTTPQGLGAHGLPEVPGPKAFPGEEGSNISAAHGKLVATFRGEDPAACEFFVGVATAPCTVFQTSTDSGKNWTRHAVPVPADSSGSILVAADPSTKGTSTIAVQNAARSEFLVYVTHDDGETWDGPTTVTDTPDTLKFKAWINYSPDGVLGLAWRSRTAAGGDSTTPYLVFAAISEDQGATWSAPLQVSKEESPGSDPLWRMGDRDDTSMIILNDDSVFVAWGDWRPGEVQGYFSAIKQEAFTP